VSTTVKVKIAVAVDPKGRWYAYGSGDAGGLLYPQNHDELLETVDIDQCGPNEALFWVSAELPVPAVQEVAGEVHAVASSEQKTG
jgi:hypothetical protein